MSVKKSLVITTINKPNKAINSFYKICKKNNVSLILIGDKKTPKYNSKYKLFDIKSQNKQLFKLSGKLPFNSYSRKNLGYLIAMKAKSKIIIETDDDNYPKNNFFQNLEKQRNSNIISGSNWINIYRYFSDLKNIWPRGFPLDEINKFKLGKKRKKNINSPVLQRMCDGNPDVDAIFRLTTNLGNIKFKNKLGFSLSKNSICPFNSQNTVWHEESFPLLYLPSYCSMRATDIWRGYIALAIMHKYNWKLSFLNSTVIQKRNIHNLLNDFDLEQSVYKYSKSFNNTLSSIDLSIKKKDILINIYKCYEALIKNKILEKRELNLVYKWLLDIHKIYPNLQKV